MPCLRTPALTALIVLVALLSFVSWADTARADDEWVLGIDELYRLDRLPRLRRSIEMGSVSSYDRSGGNNDGFSGAYSFVRKEPGGLVLADLEGPGIIYRFWTPTPTDDVVEFYIDGEEKPRIAVPFREIFLGKHEPFVAPLVGYGAGGFFSYVPIQYEKSCKVLVRAERVQFYQINWARYPGDAPIRSFDPQLSSDYLERREKARRLFASAGQKFTPFAAAPGQVLRETNTRVAVGPGGTSTVFQQSEGGGRIVGLRLSPASALAGKDRGLVLEAYWDGDDKPAIRCPAGDFFGYAWGAPAMRSLFIGTAGESAYCYFPMPFDNSARVVLRSTRKTFVELEAEIVLSSVARAKDEGRFYALWRRENPTTKGVPFTFVDTRGTGHLVGCIQQSQGLVSGNTLYFEGDDQTTIDGKLVVHGTGSEDFYNGGWYDVPGRWEARKSFPLSGCLAYQKHLGRTGGYRLMLGDAYAYRESILQTIEHAPTENSTLNDYCGVTFLYSRERPTCDISLPPPADRAVVDLRRVVFAVWWNVPVRAFSFSNASLVRKDESLADKSVRSLSFQSTGKEAWYGQPFISFECELPVAGKYRVGIVGVKGPAQGRVQLFVDEAPVGEVADLWAAAREKSPEIPLATLDLDEGANALLFKVTGKNERSTGAAFDLIEIICERVD